MEGEEGDRKPENVCSVLHRRRMRRESNFAAVGRCRAALAPDAAPVVSSLKGDPPLLGNRSQATCPTLRNIFNTSFTLADTQHSLRVDVRN